MSTKSIDESVVEELVYIGTTKRQLLLGTIGARIFRAGRFLSPGEKAALGEGESLEVSWATTLQGSAFDHKKALIQAYEQKHDRKPCYESKTNGCVPGVERGGKPSGSVGDLEWSDWRPLDASTFPYVSEEPGVFRIRIAPKR